ncbi:putative bifunctional diguanylate cyclase/phosphodiesterase [Lacimicrobium alkaliphilum]|uniref:Diguanylate cyclase n=1 Tax=Lacimicrobium alkaliphilum TaxID=1526571 RepID=A0ABQ1RHE4_9ALTE|nr:GGDEF domain-containing phosphodiesterase [Lacimicrobium alkaliphilum]GGD66608.1 hypothetical protein GCM10011357_22310 [Lacimicrobium alkaliphilum]
MQTKNKQLMRKARLVYLMIIIVGVILSLLVYSTASSVQKTSAELVERRLPDLVELRDIALLVSEQERLLYEYYATTDELLYQQAHRYQFKELKQRLSAFIATMDADMPRSPLMSELNSIERLSEALYANLSTPPADWDLSREQLYQLSELRREMLPQLNQLQQHINQKVELGYQTTTKQLKSTVWTVILFSLGMAIFSFFLGRYARNYIRLSTDNERLAMFPRRNPNPVLSLDGEGQIEYFNPAAQRLLGYLGLSVEQPSALLPESVSAAFAGIRGTGHHVRRVQDKIGQTFLNYEVHWLKDLDAFDIHIQDVTEQELAKQKLEFKAYHSELSGLGNRALLVNDADGWIQDNVPFSLVLLDLPHHSQVVGNYGLSSAMDIVAAVADYLHQQFRQLQQSLHLRSGTRLYHIADASFAIISPHLNETDAFKALCEQLVASFSQPLPTSLGKMLIGISLGVTEYPRFSRDLEEMLLHAKIATDNARSKDSGLYYFDLQEGAKHSRRLSVTHRLEQAIEAEELSLFYQPKLNLLANHATGCESLARWFSDDEVISPGEFIPLAEQSGLILPLGSWILQTACAQALAFQQQGISMKMAVNISARQFTQPGFSQQVQDVLDAKGLAPQSLELEITESMIMENEAFGIKVLHQLKEIGVSLAIDDFGTGYSSLAYLKQFPVNKLKIDQSFVRRMHQDSVDQAIVLSLCQLSRNLRMEVVAEGVEELEQLDLLRTYQCDEIQGYWYSKPLSSADFSDFMLSRQQAVN